MEEAKAVSMKPKVEKSSIFKKTKIKAKKSGEGLAKGEKKVYPPRKKHKLNQKQRQKQKQQAARSPHQISDGSEGEELESELEGDVSNEDDSESEQGARGESEAGKGPGDESEDDDDVEEPKVDKVCFYWQKYGDCRLGSACRFLHMTLEEAGIHPTKKRWGKKRSISKRKEADGEDQAQSAGAPMLPASASEMHKKYKKGEARQTVAAKAGAKLLTVLHRLSSLSTPCLAHTCNEDGLGASLYRLVVPAGLTVCVCMWCACVLIQQVAHRLSKARSWGKNVLRCDFTSLVGSLGPVEARSLSIKREVISHSKSLCDLPAVCASCGSIKQLVESFRCGLPLRLPV